MLRWPGSSRFSETSRKDRAHIEEKMMGIEHVLVRARTLLLMEKKGSDACWGDARDWTYKTWRRGCKNIEAVFFHVMATVKKCTWSMIHGVNYLGTTNAHSKSLRRSYSRKGLWWNLYRISKRAKVE